MPNNKKTIRFAARLPATIYPLLKEAADLEGRTLREFVIASACEAAKETIARGNAIQLRLAEQKRFAEAIVNPPSVAPALRKAMKSRERLLDHS
jgi:uncharacterized protein (DUF1778 family)